MAQTAKDSSSTPPKALDVIAPGKSAPAPSGRPIIVTNRPMIKDPMAPPDLQPGTGTATPGASRTGKPVTSTLLAPASSPHLVPPLVNISDRGGKKIIPTISDPATSAVPVDGRPPEPIPNIEEPSVPASAEPVADQAATPQPGTDSPAVSQGTDDTGETTHSTDVPLADNAQQREEKERAVRAAEQEKIIASKQYYLPIDTTEHRQSAYQVLLVLVLMLAVSLVWLDLVLDAGIVHLGGIHSLTHFFKS